MRCSWSIETLSASDAMRFQLPMQRFQIVDIVAFTLAFAELGQLTLSVLLLAQARLFELVEAAAALRLARPGGAGSAPSRSNSRATSQASLRASGRVNRRHQLVSLRSKLAVRGLRHAHFLFQRQHFLRRFLLFRLEGFQPLVGALRGQIRQMAPAPSRAPAPAAPGYTGMARVCCTSSASLSQSASRLSAHPLPARRPQRGLRSLS